MAKPRPKIVGQMDLPRSRVSAPFKLFYDEFNVKKMLHKDVLSLLSVT